MYDLQRIVVVPNMISGSMYTGLAWWASHRHNKWTPPSFHGNHTLQNNLFVQPYSPHNNRQATGLLVGPFMTPSGFLGWNGEAARFRSPERILFRGTTEAKVKVQTQIIYIALNQFRRIIDILISTRRKIKTPVTLKHENTLLITL